MKADSGNTFDKGGNLINKVLALIIDVSDDQLNLLINRLREEQVKRNKGRNLDTIHA